MALVLDIFENFKLGINDHYQNLLPLRGQRSVAKFVLTAKVRKRKPLPSSYPSPSSTWC